ncbi:uncharacterized protein LOC124270595 [Haliotis rubra]|uniref:uncharacterized protein LOC124270595 n=1 Tax=Haliotis rubra TaxID=36100 RepID=UPI001EE52CB2|nr:uncharacterized protein LOC124270595 [Haliotis rubra]XP_046561567.1 uncharacterized protein LOC124270595 [Haliotis rubra]XP_046561568.1 uncharacterized protein LOC124270595 [Haliotis rubra]
MAEGIKELQVEQICAKIKQELYQQLQTNTGYLFQLKQLQIQGKYEAAAPVEDTISRNSTMPKMVKDIINELGETNMEISELIGNLPAGLRDSVYSCSSGISSLPDNPDEDLTEAVQEEGNGDVGPVPMRPASEYFMERQGTASQTPRRGRGTRQVVDDTEEEPSPQSTTLQDRV